MRRSESQLIFLPIIVVLIYAPLSRCGVVVKAISRTRLPQHSPCFCGIFSLMWIPTEPFFVFFFFLFLSLFSYCYCSLWTFLVGWGYPIVIYSCRGARKRKKKKSQFHWWSIERVFQAVGTVGGGGGGVVLVAEPYSIRGLPCLKWSGDHWVATTLVSSNCMSFAWSWSCLTIKCKKKEKADADK